MQMLYNSDSFAVVQFDVEGSGYGFRVVKTIAPERAELPTSCKMKRP